MKKIVLSIGFLITVGIMFAADGGGGTESTDVFIVTTQGTDYAVLAYDYLSMAVECNRRAQDAMASIRKYESIADTVIDGVNYYSRADYAAAVARSNFQLVKKANTDAVRAMQEYYRSGEWETHSLGRSFTPGSGNIHKLTKARIFAHQVRTFAEAVCQNEISTAQNVASVLSIVEKTTPAVETEDTSSAE